MKNFFIPDPVKFGYLGGVPECPPDSIISYKKGLELGADVIYVNVSLTFDKKAIIISDSRLEPISNGTGKISVFTLKELQELDAAYFFDQKNNYPFRGKGIVFKTLDEILEMFPNVRFNININENNLLLVDVIVDVIKRTCSDDRILVSSFYHKPLKYIRKKHQCIATSLSAYEIFKLYALYKTGLLFLHKRIAGDAMQIHEVLGTSYIANRRFIQSVKARGLKVHILNVTKENQLIRTMDSGSDGFIVSDLRIFNNFEEMR